MKFQIIATLSWLVQISSAIESNIDNQLDHQKNLMRKHPGQRKLSKVNKAPKVPKTPKITKAPKGAKATKAPKVPKSPKITKAPKGTKATTRPSSQPSSVPSQAPSLSPSLRPSSVPTLAPSSIPSSVPSEVPSSVPSLVPSSEPSLQPSSGPSSVPSQVPTLLPSLKPSKAPSLQPSSGPSTSSVPSAVRLWQKIGADIDGEAENDHSGESVAVSSDGSIVAIGASYNKNAIGSTTNGHVRVFQWSTASTPPAWTQMGADIDGEAGIDWTGELAGDESGRSISLSSDGGIVAIGAPLNNGNSYGDSGHVRIYQWSGTELGWTQMGAAINGEESYDKSGVSVALSSNANIVAIGARHNDGENGCGSDSGHVRIYEWSNLAWTRKGGDIDGEKPGDEFGTSISISSDGSIVAIGALENNGNGNYNSAGYVRVYQWSTASTTPAWTQMGADIDGEKCKSPSHMFPSISVSLSSDGGIVAIGAGNNDGTSDTNGYNSGHVRVYQWSGTELGWTQMGADIDGEERNNSGFSVALSSNANIVAIGGTDRSYSFGRSGQVRMYEWSSTNLDWTQKGADIDGEAIHDRSGYSVAMSSDGSTVVIGAPENDANGSIHHNSGHVRVYQWA